MAKPFPVWLQDRLDEREWKQADLVRATGGRLRAQTVSKWLAGNGLPPELPSIELVANALQLPLEEVIHAVREEDTQVGVRVVRRSAEDIIAELEANAPLAVPIITDLVAHMGAGGGFVDDYVYLTPDYRRGRRKTIIGIRAKGECMTPLIHDGDVVLFDREAQYGPHDVVVAAIDGQAVVRRLEEVGKRMVLRADADGETHAVSDGDQIFGKVIWIMHRLVDAERRNGADKGGRE